MSRQTKSQPVSPAFFETELESLLAGEKPGKIGVAVSGGADSTALALLTKAWAEPRGIEVHGFLVDHRLRPESETEARDVAARLSAQGIPTEIRVWAHGEVTTRIHVLAREARYAFLFEMCRAQKIRHLLLAHHADDQAETVLERFAKGSGLDGLAGMARKMEREGILILRPLLGVTKEALVATCAAQGVAYVTDPSNAKSHYARGRLRKIEPLLAAEGFTKERLLDLASRARDAKEALDAQMETYLEKALREDSFGVARLNLETDSKSLTALPKEIALRALATLLQRIAPSSYAPRRAALLALYRDILSKPTFALYSLHGCLISRKRNELTILRETASQPQTTPVAPGVPFIWDKRWRLEVRDATTLLARRLSPCEAISLSPLAPCGTDKASLFEIRPLGPLSHKETDRLAPNLRKACPEGRARRALPALFKEGKLLALATFEM